MMSLIAIISAFVAGRFSVRKTGLLNQGQMYALMDCACSRGDVFSVRSLLAAGADPTGLESYGQFHALDEVGVEPMWHPVQAAFEGNAEVLDMLLAAGADPNLACGENYTPLIAAASSGHLAAVRRLIKAKVNLNIVCHDGNRTSLDMARDHGHGAVVQELLLAGAKSAKDLK